MRNMQNFIAVMGGEYGFPALIMHLMYVPFFLSVMLLNCLRESILWWVVTIIIMMVVLAVIGAFSALLFVGYRGYRIYTTRFDDDGKPRKREDQAADDPYHDVFDDSEEEEEKKSDPQPAPAAEEEKKAEAPQFEGGSRSHSFFENDSHKQSAESVHGYDSSSSMGAGHTNDLRINLHDLVSSPEEAKIIQPEQDDVLPVSQFDINIQENLRPPDIEKFGDHQGKKDRTSSNGSNKRPAPRIGVNKEDNY